MVTQMLGVVSTLPEVCVVLCMGCADALRNQRGQRPPNIQPYIENSLLESLKILDYRTDPLFLSSC